jgi:group I intron endonuclease
MVGIYKITSPSGKIYIGQSVGIKERFRGYKYLKSKRQTKLHYSLIKYGYVNHVFEIILECNIHELNKYERYYQDKYDVLSNNGLNCRLTQDGDRSGRCSEELRAKLSVISKNMSDETKQKISNAGKGRRHTEDVKLKMSKSHSGKLFSDEHKLNISKNRKGMLFSDEHKVNLSKAKKGIKQCELAVKKRSDSMKKIILNINTGIFYFGVEEAAKSIGMKPYNLTARLNGVVRNNTYFIRV